MSSIINSVPFVWAYLNISVTNVTGNGTVYTVLFDTVRAGSGYNTGTGIYTVPITGNYFISSNLFFTNIINGANNCLCAITVGGVNYRLTEGSCTAQKTPTSQYIANISIESVNLIAGDTITVFGQFNNGSTASVGINGGAAPYLTWLYITYLP